ncbi:hypothetical protein LPJ56_000784 [Coemansia sp. RSA 2599]|nr:hypothetical protein LPJ75_000416 [Coemansia sp. RSA 2598]KAJ1828927.1 hypothetical protein LPJ56_000784 [Coemansia sp. RSA 2599]
MVDLASLPDVIIKHIIRHALTPKPELSLALDLLWICHSWRQMGLALVFDHAYFIEPAEPRDTSDEARLLQRCETNIPMIVASNSTGCVKSLAVSLKTTDTLLRFLNTMDDEKLLGLGKHKWAGVKRLRVDVDWPSSRWFDGHRGGAEENRQPAADELARLLARTLKEHMPQIETLTVDSVRDGLASREASGVIIGCFLPQLSMLSSDNGAVFGGQLAANLTRIRVHMASEGANLLPGLVFGQLTQMELINVPRAFSWSLFDRSGQADEINFASLQSLKLVFRGRETSERRQGNQKIRFPKLQKLSVIGWYENYSLFNAAVFPSHLRRIELSECFGAMVEITDTQTIQTADRLTINITQDVEEHAFYRTTNHYFGANNQNVRYSELYLGYHQYPLRSENISWHSLHYLHIIHFVGFAQMLALLPRCPRLRELSISNVAFEENAEFAVLPQNLSVQKITILSDYDRDMIGCIQECIRYLVVGLARLRSLNTNIDVFRYLDSLIKEEAEEYPHLKNLAINEGELF